MVTGAGAISRLRLIRYQQNGGCYYSPIVYKYASKQQAADDLNNSWFDKISARKMLELWGMYREDE